jgi:phage recombination protein Bet
MDNKLEIVKTNNQIISFDNETINLIKNSIMPQGSTEKELELFLYQAKRTGLDPLIRQIYCIKTTDKNGKSKLSIQATIDGFRLIAERSGKYAGQTPPMWCGEDGIWVDVWLKKGFPVAAKVGIYRTDFTEPLIAVAKFETYAQKTFKDELNFTWIKMPDLMLSKCAEALALRKAFPQELSGLYTSEEMANFTEETKQIENSPEQKTTVAPTIAVEDNPYQIIKNAKTITELENSAKEIFKTNPKLKTDATFIGLCKTQRLALEEKKAEEITVEDVISENVPFPENEQGKKFNQKTFDRIKTTTGKIEYYETLSKGEQVKYSKLFEPYYNEMEGKDNE